MKERYYHDLHKISTYLACSDLTKSCLLRRAQNEEILSARPAPKGSLNWPGQIEFTVLQKPSWPFGTVLHIMPVSHDAVLEYRYALQEAAS